MKRKRTPSEEIAWWAEWRANQAKIQLELDQLEKEMRERTEREKPGAAKE